MTSGLHTALHQTLRRGRRHLFSGNDSPRRSLAPGGRVDSYTFLSNLCDAHTLDTLMAQATQGDRISLELHHVPGFCLFLLLSLSLTLLLSFSLSLFLDLKAAFQNVSRRAMLCTASSKTTPISQLSFPMVYRNHRAQMHYEGCPLSTCGFSAATDSVLRSVLAEL